MNSESLLLILINLINSKFSKKKLFLKIYIEAYWSSDCQLPILFDTKILLQECKAQFQLILEALDFAANYYKF